MRILPLFGALVAVSILAPGWAAAQGAPLDLKLRCEGVGQKLASKTSTVRRYDDKGDVTVSRATALEPDRSSEQVLVQVADGRGRIRFPPSLTPDLNDGSEDGWWPLDSLEVTGSQISGRFKINFMNKPTVRIDRVTGGVEIAGFAGLGFRGSCAPDTAPQNKF